MTKARNETGSTPADPTELVSELSALRDLGQAEPSRAVRDDRYIDIYWETDRKPAPLVDVSVIDDDAADVAAWLDPQPPSKSFKPKAGQARMGSERVSIMVVALFGLSLERLEQSVKQIARRHRAARSFLPLFLTDRTDTHLFRDLGYNFEYFPPEVYGAPDQAALLERRFKQLWKKWRGDYLIDFSAPGYLADRLEDLETYVSPPTLEKDPFNPRKKARGAPAPSPTDIIALKADYKTSGLANEPDTFVLYRILGNDLPPRHQIGQTLTNLRFLLENEPVLPMCEKRWVVNRVVNQDQEAKIIALLEEFDQPYLVIPYLTEEYAKTDWDLESFPDDAFFLRGRYEKMNQYDQLRAQAHLRRFKNNYVINNNGARNAALRDGKGRAKWVLPWDGNCFLTEAAWSEITTAVTTQPYLKYFTVPMSRTIDNADLLQDGYRPAAEEEPQMLFRRDTEEEFDETFYYGRRPKVELFYRLGVPGTWDGWPDDVWDRPRAPRSADAGSIGTAGWVARLFSGQSQLEVGQNVGLRSRGEARINAITDMLDRLDVDALNLVYSPENLTAYDEAKVVALADAEEGTSERNIHDRLEQEAELALQRGPYSVADKGAFPPSGDKQDYFNPAPYWWPNPATPNGMPYLFRDGLRIPGTRLYEPESDLYDRTRVQKLFDDSTILALAWLMTGNQAFIQHAAGLIRHWFVTEETRMNPHLLFSQVRSQTPHDHGSKSGLIEFKDLYYFLDAARLVERSGAFSEADKAALRAWLTEYLEWLDTSEQGLEEHATQNNHGTCLDLQKASIAAFVGDAARLKQIFRVSRERILEQFNPDGFQPHEMKRTQTAHYCCFNLQSWINLCNLAEACGDRLWQFEAEDGRGLAAAFHWLLPRLARTQWKYEQIEPFDQSRFLPLFYEARSRMPVSGAIQLTQPLQAKPIFFPHDGIKPFWMLGREPRETSSSPTWSNLAANTGALEVAAYRFCVPDETVVEETADARNLEKRLWSGFEGKAVAGLVAIRDDEATDQKEVNRAARSLARWHFAKGDLPGTLDNAKRIDPSGIVAQRERDLLLAHCQTETGQADEAVALLDAALKRFPKDSGLMFAMANASRASGTGDGTAPQNWINTAFRSLGLGDVVGEDGTFIGPETADEGPVRSQMEQRISVIVPVGPEDQFAAQALASLSAQTVGDLEILVADQSAGALGAGFEQVIAQDDRMTRIALPGDLPPYAVRNAALAQATGAFVTVHNADEWAHPTKLHALLQPFTDESCQSAFAHQLHALKDLTILAAWSPEFTFVTANLTSMMLRTEVLQSCGGWDAVQGQPDAYLKWRIEAAYGKEAVRAAASGVPLGIRFCDAPFMGATHLEFPYGLARDQLRRLIRHAKAEAEGASPSPEPVLASAIQPRIAEDGSPLSALFIGDFSEDATAIREICAHIRHQSETVAGIGVFHCPEYDGPGNAQLHPEVSELIDSGAIRLISAYQTVACDKAIACHSHIFDQPVDGMPDIAAAEEVLVMRGPEFTAAEFFDGHRRVLPTRGEIETAIRRPVRWMSL